MERKPVKILVRLIAVALIAVMLMSGVAASAANTKKITNAQQLAQLVYEGYNKGEKGPISITKAKLVPLVGRSQDVYVVALSGTEIATAANLNQSTDVLTDLFSGFNTNNAYYRNVVNAIRTLPKNSKLFLTGHSLGGMVAQQVAANPTIKKEYQVLYTVTFGSPLLSQGFREGTVKRFGDCVDPVPYLSINTITAPIQSFFGLIRLHGTYQNPITAHMKSYARCNVWQKYDVIGNKIVLNKGARLELDLNSQTFYPSPLIDLSFFKR